MFLASLVLYAFVALSLGTAPLDSLPSSQFLSVKTYIPRPPSNTPPQDIVMKVPSPTVTTHLFTDKEFAYLREALAIVNDEPSSQLDREKVLGKLRECFSKWASKEWSKLDPSVQYHYANLVYWSKVFYRTDYDKAMKRECKSRIKKVRKFIHDTWGPESLEMNNLADKSVAVLSYIIKRRAMELQKRKHVVVRSDYHFGELVDAWKFLVASDDEKDQSEEMLAVTSKFTRTVSKLKALLKKASTSSTVKAELGAVGKIRD